MIFLAIATLVLSGHVTDKTTGQPLPGVGVRVGASKATTDRSGAYVLRGLHPGKLTVVLESDDVPPQRFDIEIRTARGHRDFTACSTTLDYSCAPALPAPNPGT